MTINRAVQSACDELHTDLVEAESTVSYESHGDLLIIAESSQVEQFINKLPENLHPVILFTDQCTPKLASCLNRAKIPYLNQVKNIQVTGFMGQFTATSDYLSKNTRHEITARNQHKQSPLEKSGQRHFLHIHQLDEIEFDLVLDLQHKPSINSPLHPPGYFFATGGTRQCDQLLDSLPDWIGVFDKPKYFGFISERCAHSSNSVIGCSQCIEHCPAQAITSTNGKISINPYLCQGCGDCATTCPSGAMVYRYPSAKQLQDQLRNCLNVFFQQGGNKPVFLFYTRETIADDWLQQNNHLLSWATIPCAVESISAYGLDTWLAALAYGASSIILLTSNEDIDINLSLIDEQIQILDAILQGLGISDCPVQRWMVEDDLQSRTLTQLVLKHRATFSGLEDKRRMIRLAIEFLQLNYPAQVSHQLLPENALFGEIIVNRDLCTLCMSCISSCPQGALLNNEGLPQLKFVELNCVQCELCEKTCPESAIKLNPRYVYDHELVRTPRLLHEDEVIACVTCGKPFIGAQMLSSIFDKMADHPMYQGSQRSLLQMCSDCRVIALHSKQPPKH